MEGSAISPEWYKRWHRDADIDASLEELAENRHYYASAMRGHLLSLRGDEDAALEAFGEAFGSAARHPPVSLREEACHLMAWVLAFEHASTYLGDSELERWLPVDSAETARRIAKLGTLGTAVGHAYHSAMARWHLVEGRPLVARSIYDALLLARAPGVVRASWLVGAACASANLDDLAGCRASAMAAGLELSLESQTLGRVRVAIWLEAIYAALGDLAEARTWRETGDAAEAPRSTLEALRSRSDLTVGPARPRRHLAPL